MKTFFKVVVVGTAPALLAAGTLRGEGTSAPISPPAPTARKTPVEPTTQPAPVPPVQKPMFEIIDGIRG